MIVSADTADGSLVRIKDVGRVELGPNTYALGSTTRRRGDRHLPGPNSNALAALERRARRWRNEEDFPARRRLPDRLRPDAAVRTSIEKVVSTLLEAIALVVLVVVVFPRPSARLIIPLLAVPVSVVGTFAVLLLLDRSTR